MAGVLLMKQFSQTQVVIKFTTDNDKVLLTLLFIFWLARKTVYQVSYEVFMIATDFTEALNFAGKVFVIGFNSFAWGIL